MLNPSTVELLISLGAIFSVLSLFGLALWVLPWSEEEIEEVEVDMEYQALRVKRALVNSPAALRAALSPQSLPR